MILAFIYAVVAVLIYLLLPKITQSFTGKKVVSKNLLVIAGFLFFVSQFLPSPLIDGENTQFMTHVVGGGIFCGFLWLFLKENFKWKLSPLWDYLSLYFFVCGLGVANELFELAGVKIFGLNITINDTSWDLLANTVGAVLFWVAYKLLRR